MFLEIDYTAQRLLVELVQRRIDELRRQGAVKLEADARAERTLELGTLEQLLQGLHEATWDVTA